MQLREYQKAGRDFLLRQKRAILADQVGLGKTIQALEAVKVSGKKALLIAPKNVCSNWVENAEAIGLKVAKVFGDTPKQRNAELHKIDGADLVVANYAILGGKVKELTRQWPTVVVDEAQYIQNRNAVRTRNLKRLINLKATWAENVWLLTATPIWNQADALWSLLNAIDPKRFPSYWRFVYENCVVVKTPFATEIHGTKPHRVEALKEILSDVALRRKREDVLTELPPFTEKMVWLDPPKELARESRHIKKLMKEAGSLSMARLRTHLMDRDSFDFLDGERLYEKRIAPLKKAALEEILRNENGNKIIILAKYRDSLSSIKKWVDTAGVGFVNSVPICGDVPVVERERIIEDFRAAEGTSVLLGTIKTLGTGLNLQMASVMVFMEHPDMASELDQGIGRVVRMGATKAQVIYHVIQRGTLDERVYKNCKGKEVTSEEILG